MLCMPSWIPTSPSTGCDLLLSWRKVLPAGCPGLSPLPYNEPFLEEGHIFRVDWSWGLGLRSWWAWFLFSQGLASVGSCGRVQLCGYEGVSCCGDLSQQGENRVESLSNPKPAMVPTVRIRGMLTWHGREKPASLSPGTPRVSDFLVLLGTGI